MKYWKITSPGHGLPFYTEGETRQDAIKSLDWALGGHNPNRLQIQEVLFSEANAAVTGLEGDEVE